MVQSQMEVPLSTTSSRRLKLSTLLRPTTRLTLPRSSSQLGLTTPSPPQGQEDSPLLRPRLPPDRPHYQTSNWVSLAVIKNKARGLFNIPVSNSLTIENVLIDSMDSTWAMPGAIDFEETYKSSTDDSL